MRLGAGPQGDRRPGGPLQRFGLGEEGAPAQTGFDDVVGGRRGRKLIRLVVGRGWEHDEGAQAIDPEERIDRVDPVAVVDGQP